MWRYLFFFFNDTATTEIYTLSLHDALPIFFVPPNWDMRYIETFGSTMLDVYEQGMQSLEQKLRSAGVPFESLDRKSTRLNSSHANISYAVFCLKKKKK